MEIAAAGWDPSKSPIPTIGQSGKSGLVRLGVYRRDGDAGQDAGASSDKIVLQGLALAADVGIIKTMNKASQIDDDGNGRFTLSLAGTPVLEHLAIDSYTTEGVGGTTSLWEYTLVLYQIEAVEEEE